MRRKGLSGRRIYPRASDEAGKLLQDAAERLRPEMIRAARRKRELLRLLLQGGKVCWNVDAGRRR